MVEPRIRAWRATALFVVLTVVLSYPISIHPGSVLPANDPDAHLGLWELSWIAHSLVHRPWTMFNANMFYPEPRTLAYQDPVIGSAILVAPALWLTGNPVLAYNLVSLLACVLCGLGAYVLGRRVGLSEPASLLAGIVFAFCPARFLRFPQIGLAPVQWIPLTLASLHAYFEHGRKSQLRLATAFFTFQTFSSGHGAVFLTVAILLLLGYRFALGEPILLRQRLRDLGAPGVLLLAPAALLYIPFYLNQVGVGLRRPLGNWMTTPQSFFASPTYVHQYLLDAFGFPDVNAKAGGFLFTGYIPMLLALTAVAGIVWRRRHAIAVPSTRTLTLVAKICLIAAVVVAGGVTLRDVRLADVAAGPLPTSSVAWFWLAVALAAGVVLFLISHERRAGARLIRQPLVWLVVAGIAWVVIAQTRVHVPAGDGLAGQYFSNSDWQGLPVFRTADRQPSTAFLRRRWNGRPPEAFSVRWTGFLTLRRPGRYHFQTTSDDGSQLFIDDRLVVDNSGPHSLRSASGVVELDAGPHRITLDYMQIAAAYALDWSWSNDGTRYSTVPAWVLSTDRVHYRTVLAARLLDAMAWVALFLTIAASVWWLIADAPSTWLAWGKWTAGVRDDPAPLYLALTLLCVWLAIGPPYGLWQFVYSWPGFSFIRGHLRFMVLGALGIAVLAALGFDRVTARFSDGQRRAAAWVAGALMLVEFTTVPLVHVPFRVDIPRADRWLATQPKPFVIAEVPVGTTARYQTIYLLHSMAHWQKTVAGYGGIIPELNQDLNADLAGFPDETSIRHLARLGVTYIVVHFDLYQPDEREPIAMRLRAFDSMLALKYSDPTARVYAIRPSAARGLSGSRSTRQAGDRPGSSD